MIAVALSLTLASALLLNWGYLREHEAAGTLPALSISRPLHTARLLAGSRRWLGGFAAEMAGWGLFVVALALAPLALVQAVSAGGIGILAALVSRFRLRLLSRRERIGVGLSIAGLCLLGVSLTGGTGEGGEASPWALAVWLGASAAVVLAIVGPGRALGGGAAAFGAATGVMFAAGDVATKAVVAGDVALAPVMVACYGAGTMLLQMGFQRGGALVTAGLATLLTNAIPIVAGIAIFHEPLPGGASGAVRVIAFAAVVASAVFLARKPPTAVRPAHPQRGPGALHGDAHVSALRAGAEPGPPSVVVRR